MSHWLSRYIEPLGSLLKGIGLRLFHALGFELRDVGFRDARFWDLVSPRRSWVRGLVGPVLTGSETDGFGFLVTNLY